VSRRGEPPTASGDYQAGRSSALPPREAPLTLDLRVRRPGGSELVDDYVAGRGAAPSFYAHPWGVRESFRTRAAEIDARFGRDHRARAARAIHAPTDDVAAAVERVVEENGFFVTTGQQPGLFGGPLYSISKALSAVSLARAVEAELGRPVVPLFWIASDDHDWDEAHETWVVDTANDLRRFAVRRPEGYEEEPLHRIPVGAALEEALAAFLDALPETDFSPPLRELLERAWTAGSTLAEGYRTTLEGLLGPLGMAFAVAHDPALKEASMSVLRREAEEAAAHEEGLAERARELEAAGYHLQVPILEGGVNLFVEGPAGRERLYRNEEGGGFRLRHSGERLGLEDIVRRLDEAPADVTPNVLLRPVVEGTVFPTLAYVAGPGELAYYAQLEPLYRAHEVGMPVVYPRFTATVVESKVGKVLDKFDLDVASLDRPFHELAGDVARDEIPDEAREVLNELRAVVGRRTGALVDAVRDLDPTLKGPISHARSVIFDALSEAEKKIVQAAKRESEIALQ